MLHRSIAYTNYFLDEVEEYSLQAPFIYEFFLSNIKSNQEHPRTAEIESLRSELIRSTYTIQKTDFGSRAAKTYVIKVASIASRELTKAKYANLLFRILQYAQPKSVIELGTSLGINTLYLAWDMPWQVVSFEGCPETLQQARSIFAKAGVENIQTIEGDIASTLPKYLDPIRKIDFAFLDAHHEHDSTLANFDLLASKAHDKTIIVLDDIHWSKGMEKAWKAIRKDSRVIATADVFQFGIVFFNPELNREDYVLAF